jgi:Na+/proline symporter
MLLPRQFHVSVVENSSHAEVSRARWLFPLYLVAINLFVIPIAIAGLITFPFGAIDSDMYVLALPIEANSHLLSVGVFVGGLSAATAMVIVECVAPPSWSPTTSCCRWCCSEVPGRARAKRISATSCSRCGALRSSPSW